MALQQLKSVQFDQYIPFATSASGTVDFGASDICTTGGIIAAAGGNIGDVSFSCGGNITTSGGISAAGGKFLVDTCGNVMAGGGSIGGVSLSCGDITTCGYVMAGDGSIGGVSLCCGNITAAGITTLYGISAGSGRFSVESDGSISAANFSSTSSGVFIGGRTYTPVNVIIDGHSGSILMSE